MRYRLRKPSVGYRVARANDKTTAHLFAGVAPQYTKGIAMTTTACNHVTLVEVLELTGSFAEFAAVSQSLARRLEAEGIAELVSAQFYAASPATEVGALITFTDYRQVTRHITMITAWDEFRQLLGLTKLIDMRVYGPLGEEGLAFLRTMNGVSKRFATPMAGFVRWATHEAPGYRAGGETASRTHEQSKT
jgi:hypothetical protein